MTKSSPHWVFLLGPRSFGHALRMIGVKSHGISGFGALNPEFHKK
ncbi:hypothetical protein [Lutispora sp.]|nr:hypothetical protein [Lutispora sp.]MEA4963034.1 hypothetical protein [Lutispora sp.]